MSKESGLSLVDRVLIAAVRPIPWASSIIIATICLTTAADALSRSIGTGSLPVVFDLNATLLLIMVFVSLGYVQLGDGHIAFSMVYERLPGKVREKVRLSGLGWAAVILGCAAWWSGGAAWDSLQAGETRLGATDFPAWPGRLAVALGLALLLAVLIRQCWLIARGKDPALIEGPSETLE